MISYECFHLTESLVVLLTRTAGVLVAERCGDAVRTTSELGDVTGYDHIDTVVYITHIHTHTYAYMNTITLDNKKLSYRKQIARQMRT